MVDGHRTTVLVVDDEAFVRMDLVDTLTAAGYRTREAGCAAEAIEILEQDPDIAVAFHGYSNAGVHGRACAVALRPKAVAAICHRHQLGELFTRSGRPAQWC